MGGGILNKNAFTLIELLAIIVILAIIAVITVPIILNIIENSKKGAATDSAYGYKDAVNKYYVTELSKLENRDLVLQGEYTVKANGVLDGSGISNKEIPVSGDKPSSGKLRYSNNVLNAGCLVIGDYSVIFEGGNTTSTTKGDCSDYEFPSENSGSSSNEQGNGGSQQAINPYLTTFDGTYVYKMGSNYSTGYEQDEEGWYISLNPAVTGGYIRKNVSTQEIEICSIFNSNTVCVKNNADDYGYGSEIVCDENDENCYLKPGYLAYKKEEFESKGATCEVDNQVSLRCYYDDSSPIIVITPYSEESYFVSECYMSSASNLECY